MNENVKKAALVIVIVAAVGFAVFEGVTVMQGPAEIKHEIGHGTPGHGMKAQEDADSKGPAAAGKADPLAGPG